MSNTVIKVEGLSKQYKLGLVGTGTLGHDLNRFWHKVRGKEDPYLMVGEENDREVKSKSDYVWALRDINFEIQQGEVFGIIGRNGAGKSTLLKVLSKITQPTLGSVSIKGRIASLLEVGTGFHPELTGRENIFLNGAILGMTKADIRSKFDEIVDFSGVERYIDTPVKRYSSGMYVRLAFAVAAHLEPEILIVDEVLAVGDIEFQKKCVGKMKHVGETEGRTVLFVSHNMGIIQSLCKKGILLENGAIKASGEIGHITRLYFKQNSDREGVFNPGRLDKSEKLVINEVVLTNQDGVRTETFKIGDSISIEMNIEAQEDIIAPYIWLGIRNHIGAFASANSLLDGIRTSKLVKGTNIVKCTFKGLPLLPNEYQIHAGMRTNDGKTFLIQSKQIGFFMMDSDIKKVGLNGEMAMELAMESASPMLPYEWDFGNGEKYSFNILENVKR